MTFSSRAPWGAVNQRIMLNARFKFTATVARDMVKGSTSDQSAHKFFKLIDGDHPCLESYHVATGKPGVRG